MCKKFDHTKAQCWYNDKEANVAENAGEETKNEETEGLLFMVNGSKEASQVWLIDSDCSNHMSGNKELFQNLVNTS